MDLGSLFLILALLILVGLFVSRPFLERRGAISELSTAPQDKRRSTLLAERDRLLNAIQELDFDQALGKIPDEDYPSQREVLMIRGAQVLRQLDSLEFEGSGDDVESRLEAAVANRRVESTPLEEVQQDELASLSNNSGISASIVPPDDDLEILLARRRRERQEKASGFCPQCGGPVQRSDCFCPKCGAKME